MWQFRGRWRDCMLDGSSRNGRRGSPIETTIARALPTFAAIPTIAARTRLGLEIAQSDPPAVAEHFALVDPGFHADDPVGSVRFRKTVVDIRAKSVQRQLPLQIPLTACDFRTVQTARHANL